VPQSVCNLLIDAVENGVCPSREELGERAVLGVLRLRSKEQLSSLPALSEGIENRLYSAARMSNSLPQLFDYTATKRYTNARLRRLVLSAFLKAKADEVPSKVPYIRVLGCNSKGAEILKSARENSKIPVIMRSTALKENHVFEFEVKASDVYTLSQAVPDPCGSEFTNGVIVKKD
jgi:predicted nucleotidyltransferase